MPESKLNLLIKLKKHHKEQKAILSGRLQFACILKIRCVSKSIYLNSFKSLFSDYSACTNVTLCVISFAFIDSDTLDACVDELECPGFVVSRNYNTNMAYILAAATAGKEHEIALAEVLAVNAHTISVLNTRSR